MDLETFQALRSPAGEALLARLAEQGPLDDAGALRLGSALRREYPADFVAAAVTMTRLRERARTKFGRAADRLWLHADGLEQATHPTVAAHRARRIVDALGPGASVADLCCGIGSELLALAAAGLAPVGVELDPLTAAMAAANSGGPVECADATARELGEAAVFVDPARRTTRGRVFDPASYRPPWTFVLDVLSSRPAGAAKVAPGIAHEIVPPGVETEWVSLHGEVKEAALYGGALTGGVRRRATLLPSGATLASAVADYEVDPPPVGPVGRWLYEPDGAVIRAHLVDSVVAAVDGWLVDPTIAYVSADRPVSTPFAKAYEVTDVLPFNPTKVRALLRTRGVGVLTVKKRGSSIDPERLRRDLLRGGHGGAEATLVVTKVAGAATAILVKPVGHFP
ncbi:MAG: THUMP-like domain-containing protein [Sporichthyaceae bacterium]